MLYIVLCNVLDDDLVKFSWKIVQHQDGRRRERGMPRPLLINYKLFSEFMTKSPLYYMHKSQEA
jgi:hypothetical protein